MLLHSTAQGATLRPVSSEGPSARMGRLWSGDSDTATAGIAQARVFDTPTPGPLGDELKGMFDILCDGPMPKRLLDLADALEEAFQRGDLHAAPCARDTLSR